MTQDLIADLSKISGLFVIAHNSVLEYRARPVNLENGSRELGVRYVVDGSTRRASDHVRIAAELLDTKTGRALWSDRYDRDVKDIFSVQDEITRKIAADLNVEVKEAEFKRVRRIPTENLSAYDSFLRGTDLWRRVTPESTREAQRMFERAVELDPKFAAAYAYLGFIKLREMELFWSLGAPAAIRALADKALSADDSDPMAHILSACWLQGEGKLDRAEAE
jgi:adenylate cyclase